MEFKRINKDTVTCIITEDDMDEQGIKLEDLFEKKKEALWPLYLGAVLIWLKGMYDLLEFIAIDLGWIR